MNKAKKQFSEIELDLITFLGKDVITTSGIEGKLDDWGEGGTDEQLAPISGV